MSADHLVASQSQGIDLIGPVAEDRSWQALAGTGLDTAAFTIDWEKKQAICPQGHPSRKGSVLQQNKTTVYNFRFHRRHCDHCPVRAHCTQSATSPRL